MIEGKNTYKPTLWDKICWKSTPIWEFFRYDIPQGIRQLYIWFPIIWRNRDWDWIFLIVLMRKQLVLMEEAEKYSYHTTAERDAKNIRTCITLIDRIAGNGIYEWGEPYSYKVQALKIMGHRGLRAVYRHEDAMKQRDINYLFFMLSKHLQKWWS